MSSIIPHCSSSILLKSTSLCFTKWLSEMVPASLREWRSFICWIYVERKLATLDGVRFPPKWASFFPCDLNIDHLGGISKLLCLPESIVSVQMWYCIALYFVPCFSFSWSIRSSIRSSFSSCHDFFFLCFYLVVCCFSGVSYEHSSVAGMLWACRWDNRGSRMTHAPQSDRMVVSRLE